jgi:alpha-L-rhamnosidase
MGYYELYVNGQKVGTDVLSPAVSLYTKRSYYLTYDVMPFLRKGRNQIGLWTSPGWYWPGYPGVEYPSAIARLQLELDGSAGGPCDIIGTDATWTTHTSNHSILGSWSWDDFGGERIDARADDPGWCMPDRDGAGWLPALVVNSPAGLVVAQMCQPNRIGEEIHAVSVTSLGDGRYELDFGAVLTGWLRLRLSGLQVGHKIVMHFADKRFETPNGDNTPAGFIKASEPTKTFATYMDRLLTNAITKPANSSPLAALARCSSISSTTPPFATWLSRACPLCPHATTPPLC